MTQAIWNLELNKIKVEYYFVILILICHIKL